MKNILIGVNSGIACYKALDICSKLKKEGYNVTVMMSENATKLISPSLFQIITENKVYTDLFDGQDTKVSHIELAKNSDLVVLVPATFNIIGKIANGIADDFISTTIAATNFNKIMIIPAMNTNMYTNPILQENLNKLRSLGMDIVKPDSGILACGDVGIGKLPSVDSIINDILYKAKYNPLLKGKNLLITAGGTVEKIDPVRCITNKSSGKMGYALAKQAALLGANVTLITTKTNLELPRGLNKVIHVESADQMYEAVMNNYMDMDGIIKVAAVSDFKVKNCCDYKIKKNEMKNLTLELELNKDILFELSKISPRNFKLVGFAAESNDIKENAIKKLKNKNLDYIILNDISKDDIGFNSDYNKVYIYDKYGNEKELDKDTKDNLAIHILKHLFL